MELGFHTQPLSPFNGRTYNIALVTSKLLLRRPFFPGVRRESSTCACCHCCRHQRHQNRSSSKNRAMFWGTTVEWYFLKKGGSFWDPAPVIRSLNQKFKSELSHPQHHYLQQQQQQLASQRQSCGIGARCRRRRAHTMGLRGRRRRGT